MSNVLEQAKLYKSLGLSVIPLKRGEKTPAIAWGEYQKRQATDDEIEQWFGGNAYNIGIVTGKVSGILVIDEDSYKSNEASRSPFEVVATYTVATPSGGLHRYYQLPEGVEVSNSVDAVTHRDVRAEGGYVVAPPSVVGGKAYEVVDESPVAVFPRWGLGIIGGRKESDYPPSDKPDGFELLQQVVQRGFTDGQHNNQMLDLARLMARGVNDPEFGKRLTERLVYLLDNKDPTPQGETAVKATVQQAWDYETKRLAKKQVDATASGSGFMKLELLDSFIEANLGQATRYLVKDWLPEGGIIMMAAPPQSYKTWITYWLALCVAYGVQGDRTPMFLGQYPATSAPKKVLIFQLEDRASKIAERLATMRYAMEARGEICTTQATRKPDGGVIIRTFTPEIYIHAGVDLSLTEEKSVKKLEELIEDIRPDLILIDPLGRAASSSDKFFSDAYEFMKPVVDARNKYNTATIISHHTRKSSSGAVATKAMGGDFRQSILGSALLNGSVTGVIHTDSYSEDRSQFILQRSGKDYNSPEYLGVVIQWDIRTPSPEQDDISFDISVTPLEEASVAGLGKYESMILKLLRKHAGEFFTVKEIKELLVESGEEVAASNLYAPLKALVKASLVREEQASPKSYAVKEDL